MSYPARAEGLVNSIIPHRLPGFLEFLMPLKNWWSIHARWSKSIPYVSVAFFPILKLNFIAYRSCKVSDCIFEISPPVGSVYSNCCCSCWFESEIIEISQSSHKMYSNNIVNFQESTTILNACTKNVWKLVGFDVWKAFLVVLFGGFLIPLCIFSANYNPLFISVFWNSLWCRVVCSSLRRVSFEVFIWDYYVHSTC